MRKIVLYSSLAVLGLCSFAGVSPKRSVGAHGEDVETLVKSYINSAKQYTKKTEIFLNDEAVAQCDKYFHGGSVSLKRRTYYDETADALLMVSYDGTLGINSGYGANAGNMEHYSYTGEAKPAKVSSFFSMRDVNYVVNGTTPNQYFENLSKIAEEVKEHDWVEEAGKYKYTINDLTVDGNGDYKDHLFHKIQFFAAPLLLQSVASDGEHYLSPDKIYVYEDAGKLTIDLCATSDSGKIQGGGTVLARASVEAGINYNQ